MFCRLLVLSGLIFSSISFCQNSFIFYRDSRDTKIEQVKDFNASEFPITNVNASSRKIHGQDGNFIMSIPRENRISHNEEKDSIRFSLGFDNYCFIFVLFNNDFHVDDASAVWNNEHTFCEVTVPAGTYQLFSYSQFYDPLKDAFVIKEDIDISKPDTLHISYNDTYPVTVNNLDENGNLLSIIQEFYWTPVQIYYANTNAHFSFQGYTFFNLYCSGFSDSVWFSCGLHRADLTDSKTIYVINHQILSGLNGPVSLTNNPQDFTEENIDFYCGDSDSSTVGFIDWVRFGGDYLMGWGATNKTDGSAWNGKLFLTPFNSKETGFCTGLFSVDNNQNVSVYTDGIQTENNKMFNYYMAGFYNAPPNTILFPSGSDISLGYTAAFTDAYLYNTENTVSIMNQYFGLAKEYRPKDLYNSTYRLYDTSNNLISEGIIGNTVTLYVPADNYILKTVDTNSVLGRGEAEVITSQIFNLKNTDKNPPYITSLNITDDNGIPSRHLESNSSAELIFSANDPENVFNKDSVRVQFQKEESGEWQDLPAEFLLYDDRIGYLYKSDLSPVTNYDSASIDLNLIFSDASGNKTGLTLQPGITIGKYGTTNNTSVNSNTIEADYSLNNYPNPFNPYTMIRYTIPKSSRVGLIIYDILGREVEKLVDEEKPSGTYEVSFNAANMSSGIYFYTLTSSEYTITKKMLLLK